MTASGGFATVGFEATPAGSGHYLAAIVAVCELAANGRNLVERTWAGSKTRCSVRRRLAHSG
jgi:hypothetical protein